ncbi:g1893 [Coccomyxa elongata]
MGASFCIDLVSPHSHGAKIIYTVVIGLPTVLFLAFLGWRLLPSIRKLQRSQSHIMTTYYGFLWGVSLLNLMRCIALVAQDLQPSGDEYLPPLLLNHLWLLTRFGLVMLEVSVVVFLLQGYLTSGREALIRTLWISGAYAAFETLVASMYIFVAHVPLFLYGGSPEAPENDLHWSKWGFWLAHTVLFLMVYALILILPNTKWRDRLPAKPSFYRYILVLFGLNVLAGLGSILLGSVVVGGYCVYGLATFLYYAIYPPLLYLTFLSEFFGSNEELDMDLMYYSEMKEAGYFEEDDYDY